MTCSPGLLFDRKFGDCNLEIKVQCETANTICEPFRHLNYIIIGNPLDCSRFVEMSILGYNQHKFIFSVIIVV